MGNTTIKFGTYNVDSSNSNSTVTYTAPSMLPREEVEKFTFTQSQNDEQQSGLNELDKQLTGILSVPKPVK